jgi:hypothetical protein
MIGKLLRSRDRRTPERPSFRPVLETLENREVPTAAQVSAAFNQLPTDVNTLQASLAARPVNIDTFNTNLTAVANDLVTLGIGAPGFVAGDRLRIDNALYSTGLLLMYDGNTNFTVLPPPQYFNIVLLGQGSVNQGFLDAWVATVSPSSSGTATLT